MVTIADIPGALQKIVSVGECLCPNKGTTQYTKDFWKVGAIIELVVCKKFDQ